MGRSGLGGWASHDHRCAQVRREGRGRLGIQACPKRVEDASEERPRSGSEDDVGDVRVGQPDRPKLVDIGLFDGRGVARYEQPR